MGQFGNQPDFGTQALTLTPTGDHLQPENGYYINPPCALYIGTGGDLLVNVVGGDATSSFGTNATLFKNVASGTFMPVMVSYVWATSDGTPTTTASDIVGLY